MRPRAVWILSVSVLLVLLTPYCSKKETAPPPKATAEVPKDGVGSVPPAAERDANMAAVESPVAGAVKEVKAKVLDKEAEDKSKSLIRMKVFALDGPVDVSDNTKFEIWRPGSDTEEQKPEMSQWATAEAEVPPGTWDIRLHYEESQNCKADGWIKNVTFTAGKLWKAEIVMAAPMQYVRIFGALDGQDVGDNMKVEVFKAGTDQQEFQPIASFWSTQKVAIAAGSYDLRLSYDRDKVKARGTLNGFSVGGNHGILKTTGTLTKEGS